MRSSDPCGTIRAAWTAKAILNLLPPDSVQPECRKTICQCDQMDETRALLWLPNQTKLVDFIEEVGFVSIDTKIRSGFSSQQRPIAERQNGVSNILGAIEIPGK